MQVKIILNDVWSNVKWASLDVFAPTGVQCLSCAVDGTPRARVSGELFEAGFYALDDLPGPIALGQREIIEHGLRKVGRVEEWKNGRVEG
jgi:hypothetical protein